MICPTPAGISGASAPSLRARGAHHHPLGSISPLTSVLSSHSDHALFGVPRGYTTAAFAGGVGDNLLFGLDRLGGEGGSDKKKKASLARSMSDVAVPDPPTSNHLHKSIPGATGKLFYTET